jgi:hypothetical protein
VEQLAHVDAAVDQGGPGGLDVGDDQVQALAAAGGDRGDALADDDRAGRPRWGELHDPELVAGLVVDVEGEADLVGIEVPGPVHIGDRDHHDLEFHVHDAVSLVPGVSTVLGTCNAGRPGTHR